MLHLLIKNFRRLVKNRNALKEKEETVVKKEEEVVVVNSAIDDLFLQEDDQVKCNAHHPVVQMFSKNVFFIKFVASYIYFRTQW